MIKKYKISVPKSTLNNIYKKVRNYPWKDIQKLNGWTHGTNYDLSRLFLFEETNLEPQYLDLYLVSLIAYNPQMEF